MIFYDKYNGTCTKLDYVQASYVLNSAMYATLA